MAKALDGVLIKKAIDKKHIQTSKLKTYACMDPRQGTYILQESLHIFSIL